MASFESFRRVDVYGFAMVMWETVRRCMTHDGVEVSCLDDEDNGVDCSGDYDDDDNENDDNGSFSGFCVAIPRHGPPRSRLRGHAQGTRMPKYCGFQTSEEKNSLVENLCKTVFQVVCVDSYRPQIPPRWEGDKVKKDKKQ